ncbi:MAG: DNA topoisomerase VI, partial [Candidatus Micrarchaeia archaeon]
MADKLTVEKLENLGKSMIEQVNNGDGPTFETVLRSRGNTFYDEGLKCLRLGDKNEIRKFLSVAQAKTFMQTVAVASKTKKFVKEDLHTSIRGLYYQLKFTLGEDVD